jgi:hypothetical protein
VGTIIARLSGYFSNGLNGVFCSYWINTFMEMAEMRMVVNYMM